MAETLSTFTKRLADIALVEKIPIFGSFELTPRCNLNCKMCFICNPEQTQANELSTEQWLEIGRQARDAGLLYLTLSGGEAMIRKDFKELYTGLQHLGLVIMLNTNGTTLTPDMVKFLASCPPRGINVSLYGSSPEAYERVTGSAAAYEQVMRGIDLLEEYGLRYRLRTILIRETAEDLNNIAGFILGRGKRVGLVNYITPSFDEGGNDPLGARLDAQELLVYERKLSTFMTEWSKQHPELWEKSSLEFDRDTKPGTEIIDTDEMHELAKAELSKTAYHCHASRIAFWVSYHGLLVPCALLREPYVDLRTTAFDEAWRQLRELCAQVPKCADCEACPRNGRCGNCPARLKAETGSFSQKSPYLCSFAEAYIKVKE